MLRRANCPSWPGGVAAAKRIIAKHPLCRRRGGGSINFCRTWTTTPSAPAPSAIGAYQQLVHTFIDRTYRGNHLTFGSEVLPASLTLQSDETFAQGREGNCG